MKAIGLISGTSVDGIDGALVEISGTGYDLTIHSLHTQIYPYPGDLAAELLALGEGQAVTALTFGRLHQEVGEVFGAAALALLTAAQVKASEVGVIGSHGQTVAHQPPGAAAGFSVQLGDGAVIQALTGIPTVTNFRARDLAAGGEGAPLIPILDWVVGRHPQHSRCFQNIGGIGNVTYLPAGAGLDQVRAFDTGPGNMLLDRITQIFWGEKFDTGGARASQGQIHQPLLTALLDDPYLRQPPPKSTGRERYGLAYLQTWLDHFPISGCDLLATFGELTCRSIADSYRAFLPALPDTLFLSGGGVHNQYLWTRLRALLPSVDIQSIRSLGIAPDDKEAIGFALLGYLRQRGLPGKVPIVTGAAQALVLGDYCT